MSTDLYWRPVATTKKPVGGYDTKLKSALLQRYGFLVSGPVILDDASIPYLDGLRDAGISDAAVLIALIGKHGEIEIWLE